MNIAIIEPSAHGHSTYVETMISVFSSYSGNNISLFAHPDILKALDSKKLQGVNVIEIQDAKSIWKLISGTSLKHIICVTLEPVSKNTYHWARSIIKANTKAEIHFVVHNINFWKPLGFFTALKNSLSGTRSIPALLLNFRKWFLYIPQTRSIIRRVNSSKGKFILVSDAVRKEFERQLGLKNTWVIPFSVFTEGNLHATAPTDSGLRICIPGIVSSRRRDYDSVLEAMQNPCLTQFRNRITWDLLGRINQAEGGEEIAEKCRQLIAQGHQILLHGDKLIPMDTFDSLLQQADIILGNLKVSISRDAQYGISKESGLVYNMIKAAKPGLIKDDYPFDQELSSSVLSFSKYEQLPEAIIQLLDHPELLNKLASEALLNARKYRPEIIYAGLFLRE